MFEALHVRLRCGACSLNHRVFGLQAEIVMMHEDLQQNKVLSKCVNAPPSARVE